MLTSPFRRRSIRLSDYGCSISAQLVWPGTGCMSWWRLELPGPGGAAHEYFSIAMISRELAPPSVGVDPQFRMDTMCHDLRQPVAAIIMLAAAAAAEVEVSDSTRVRLEQITTEAEWMSSIIREVLATRAATEDIDLRDTARQTACDPGRADVTCQMELPDRPVRVRANATLIRRAVANLVENACRAAGPGGAINVSVRQTGRWAVVEVEDSGPGYGHIAPGCGLGLEVVARAAADHGGRVDIGRSRLGGARVCLRLCTEA
jgi:signal transduction histidine kinase